MEEDAPEAEGDEGKSGDEGEVKTEMESNGQNMSGFHFLTEEEAETTDITDVSKNEIGLREQIPFKSVVRCASLLCAGFIAIIYLFSLKSVLYSFVYCRD
ncbi:hypothetical protein E2C01_090754 [Portunus trituberculatus]|uniref:Uncharacterized protein n=1 Tax=Portunus trituberculatus TaxID=210409 RepID=A0A5B7JR88_PORTR|nr:hypothetical protein [Portunus trituberculatus]